MGRPPAHGAPTFRFNASEVAEMENILREHSGQVPHRNFLVSLATKFSNSPDRAGKSIVQMKQVWNWFQNRRYALRAKLVKSPGNPNVPSNLQGEGPSIRNVPPVVHQQAPVPLGHNLVRNASENPPMEFEAKSARDGAWYDVQEFLSHRNFEADNPEVLVRFAGFGQEEDEWVNVLKHVRHRSLPCESTECLIVLPGDLILCFQEGKEQALYFDAHVLDAQRRRHDVRGCRCRFLVRYDHDQSEEIVPLRKICRRPDTDYRLQLLNSANESAAAASPVVADSKRPAADPASSSSLRVPNPSTSPVAFPSHTIVNPSAGVPHSTLFPAAASAPTPALITTPSQSLTSSSAQAPAPSLITTPSQSLTSDPAPVLAPAPAPTPASAPAPTPTPASAPAPAPTPTPAQAQSLAPAPAPTLAPPEAPFPAAAPSQTPALAPAQVPALATHGAPASASATTPSLTPMSAPTPSSIVVSAPTPSMPIPSPDPTLTAISVPSLIPPVIPAPVPVPVPVPAPAPAPLPAQILVSTPTILTSSASPIITENTESGNPATSSAGEASAREIITNPSVASMVMEDKKDEISILGTSALVTGGSSVLQGETSENPAVTVISQEKVDSIIAQSEPVNLSSAPMEGGPSVSTMAESSNVLSVSVDDTKAKQRIVSLV